MYLIAETLTIERRMFMKRFLSVMMAAAIMAMLFTGMVPAYADTLPYGLPELDITSDTVTYLTWDSQRNIDKDPANLLMQEVYGCKLKVVRTTYAELANKAATLRMSGSTPDLIKFKDMEFPSFINNDIVADVTDYLDYSNPLWAGLEDTANAYSFKDRCYVFPCGKVANNNYVYYWTSYFEDYGLETPLEMYKNGEWTMSAMRDMMKELTTDDDRDGIVDVYGLVLTPIYSFNMSGEDLVIWDETQSKYVNNLRSPKIAEFFDWIYETGSAGDDSRLMSLEDVSCFTAKSAVMMLGEAWVRSEFYDEICNGEIEFAPAPRMDSNDEYFARGRAEVYWMGKESANPNGALAYLACCRAISLNEGLGEELAARAGMEYNKWPEEIEELKDMMDDPENFHFVISRALGMGNWGSSDSGDGIFDMLSCITQFELPWQTVLEKHYPLLQDSIDIMNGDK